MTKEKVEKVKACIAISILILVLVIIAIVMIRYEVEGEKNMPFKLSKITIISTAEGVEKKELTEEEQANKWNLAIFQNNDVYFFLDKNENQKENEVINQVKIENIVITKQPIKGSVQTYMPNSVEGRIYSYEDRYLVQDSITYQGAVKSDSKTLEIGNQGGSFGIRFSNTKVANISNNDEEIVHDGTLLAKAGITTEEIAFNVNFDLIIDLKTKKYKSNITLCMPCGNIVEEGTCTTEKIDMSDIVFKRM